MNGDVLDTIEVAEMLKISPTNVRQLVFRKKLEPVGRKSRRSLFNKEQVLAIAEQRAPKPQPVSDEYPES